MDTAVCAWIGGESVREGRMQTAFDAYADHGRIHTADTIEAVREQLVADYLSARAEHDDPRQVLILARTRSQAATLNPEVRRHLLADGRLSAAALHVRTDDRDIDFRVGDDVIVTRNLHQTNLFNGTRATVTGVGFDGLVLTTATGRPVPLDRCSVGRALDHGYALTIHKAQGLTVERALLWASPGLYREAGTSVCRARGRQRTSTCHQPSIPATTSTAGHRADPRTALAQRPCTSLPTSNAAISNTSPDPASTR